MKFLILLLTITSFNAVARNCVATPAPKIPASIKVDKVWSEAFDGVFEVLCSNLRKPDYFYRGYRSHPGPPYKAAYLWDTAFISQVWLKWDPTIAEELIHYVLRFQKKNGKIHHAVAEIVVKPVAYSDTQPPLLAWASWEIYKKTKNKDFLNRVYPKLKLYHSWLKEERKHPDGLFFWKTPYESGIDNSPRFSNRDESWFDDTTKMAAVDMSSYMAISMEALGKMAQELGLREESQAFKKEYQELKRIMNAKLWNHEEQMYFDWDYRTNAHIKIHTVSDLTPMVAGIPNAGQAFSMMRKIMDPLYYNTLIPFPSVARFETLFVKDMWRGPVWINMAYLGVLGVERYGYHREARTLARKTVAGVYETWANEKYFYEFYDPDRYDIKELNRKKGNLWKRITLGSKPVKNFVGWTGLANSLLLDFGSEF